MDQEKLNSIIALIETTIENKKKYAMKLRDDRLMSMGESLAARAVADFLDVNVEELQKIANDLKTV